MPPLIYVGFATIVTAEQNSAIMMLTSVAPTMPPTPPPSPPRPGQTHYGNPFDGTCESDERNITITGVPGAVCSPICTGLLKTKVRVRRLRVFHPVFCVCVCVCV